MLSFYYIQNFSIRVVIFLLLYSLFEKIYKQKKIYEFDVFLIFNIITVLYFVTISGLWGNPRYLAPCSPSIFLFFSMGIEKIINFFKKK